MGDGCREVVIRELSTQRGGAPSAQQLYEETADSLDRRERRQERLRYAVEPARSIRKGRPTKREGRQLRTVRGSAAAD
jgi:ribosome-associated heat shock protein Hsp15